MDHRHGLHGHRRTLTPVHVSHRAVPRRGRAHAARRGGGDVAAPDADECAPPKLPHPPPSTWRVVIASVHVAGILIASSSFLKGIVRGPAEAEYMGTQRLRDTLRVAVRLPQTT